MMREKYKILINAKWHRVNFTPALNISKDQLNFVLDKFMICFKEISQNWNPDNE
jgi:acetylornithine/succinyldiaminopimelate/putrescine aminotransferase